MIPTFASGTLNGKPALLQYIPGKHVLNLAQQTVTLNVTGDYPQTGDFEIEVEIDEAMQFPIILRVPTWATKFEATIDGTTYTPKDSRMIEIERNWSSGDKIEVTIPLEIRRVTDGDKTTESIAFVRGPQVLATDTAVNAEGSIPKSDWWGETIYTEIAKQNGADKEFKLVTFADAGQNKEEYAALQDGIEPS